MRVNYVKYNKDTGEIRQWGTCGADNLILDPSHKEGDLLVLRGEGTNTTHYVQLPGLVIAQKPPQPSVNHVFDFARRAWVDPRTLDDMKALKWAEIKQARDLAEYGEFVYNDMVFDGDLDAQRRLAGCISLSKSAIAAGEAFQTAFTLSDNTVVTLTAEDFVGIEVAKLQAVATAFSHASALRTQIQGTTSIAQLSLINWNTGL